ncbi:MAG: 6-carboxytetrahydropterin synthase QueD [Turneriella sp.]|nr:6-carboxytetrahydropterin synthase QueD [Turneriella sp.]
MLIEKDFVFDAAHFLPYVPAEHKCRRLHGHTYTVIAAVSGECTKEGWVMDFAEIAEAIQPILKQIDHRLLNAIPGLENPTAENIAHWIYERAKIKLPQLVYITVQEGLSARAIFPQRSHGQ